MKQKMKLMALVPLMLLGGCLNGAGNEADFCQVSSPIRPSIEDVFSDSTARQILAHNLTGDKICGWKP